MSVGTLAEWKELPELGCPAVSPDDDGASYTVRKVGFLAVDLSDCKPSDAAGAVADGGKYFFPTIEIQSAGVRKLYRLPVQLSDWAIEAVARAQQSGQSPFPMQVEFGVLDGRHYAEML